MNITIFISMLFLFQSLYWIVGRLSSKKLTNKDDYFLAGKNVTFFPLMMTFLATQVGGGSILGSAEEAYQFGYSVLLYPIGMALGLMILGLGIGKKLSLFNITTVAEIFEVFYYSKLLRKIASFISILSLFMVLIAQIMASSKFLISIGMANTSLFCLFWMIVIIYTVQGGLKAVISTDMVQAAVFSFVLLLCFGLIFSMPSFEATKQFVAPSISSSKLCGWLFMPLFFMIIEQDMGQRCFAGKSPTVVSKAAFFSGIVLMIVCIVPVFLGILANTMNLYVPPGSSVLMTVIEKTTNPWISAFAGCAILAAIISTATSLINAISSNIASDFKIRILKNKNELTPIKIVTALLSIGALICAFYFDNVVDVLIQSYELCACILFIPVIFALFKQRGNYYSALVSVIIGMIGFILFRLFPIPFPKELMTIFLAGVGYITVEILCRCVQKNYNPGG